MKVVPVLKPVDHVFLFIDADTSFIKTLTQLIDKAKRFGEFSEIVFIKDSDRLASEIPESKFLMDKNIKIIDRLGEKNFSFKRFK